MFRNMKKVLSFLTVFLVVFSQIQIPLNVKAENDLGVEVSLEIDESIGSLEVNFDYIDRFNEYGIAIIVKDTYNDNNELVKRYGLINKLGEVLLEPIYTSIIDYNEDYYSVLNYESFNYLEGVASKRTGQLVLPVVYNYIPYMDNNGIYNLTREVSSQVWKTDLVSYSEGVIQYADLPESFESDLYNNLWSMKLFDDVYQINGYREYKDGEMTFYDSINWLSNEKGEILFDQLDMYISGFHKLNNAYYFTTNNFGGDVSSSKGGLFKLSIVNGEAKIEMLLNPNDYNGAWLDTSKNEVEVYRVTNNNWSTSRYHLETGWIGGLGFGGYQESIFSYYSNPKFNMSMKCTNLETRVCSHFLTLASDSTNQNLFGDKEYTYIINSMFDEYYILHNEVENKSNIFIQRDGKYFLAFSEDVSGWIWVDQNQLINTQGKLIDLATLNETTPFDEIESYQSVESHNIYIIDNRFLVYNDYFNKTSSIKDRINNVFILNQIESIYKTEFKYNFLTGVYRTNSSGSLETRVFVYSALNNSIILDIVANDISEMSEFGYVIVSSNSGKKLMYYKDGTNIVSEADDNFKIELRNNETIALGSGNNVYNLYLLNGNQRTLYSDLDELVISDNAPILLSSSIGQKYLKEGLELDTTGLTKVGSFVQGLAYVKDENGIYQVISNDVQSKSNPVIDAVDFKGSILELSDNNYVYRVRDTETILPLGINSTGSLKQISEFVYEYISDSNKKQIIAYDTLNNKVNRFYDVYEINDFTHDDVSVVYQIKHVLEGKYLISLLTDDGQLIDQIENGSLNLNKNYYLRNSNGVYSIHNYKGENLASGTSIETFRNLSELSNNYAYVTNNENIQELIFIGSDKIKQFSNVYFDSSLKSNRFFQISKYIENQPQSVGLVDVDGNLIVDVALGSVGININDKYKLIQPFRNENNQSVFSGIYNFAGEPVQELIGYENDNNLNVSDDGILKVRKHSGYYRMCYDITNKPFLCKDYKQNEYNINTGKLVYSEDYVNLSLIDNGSLKRISRLSFTLESQIPENSLNYYSGDIYYDINGNRVRATFKESYYDLQNKPIFNQLEYDNVRFDGQNFIATIISDNETTSETLISKTGEILLSEFSNINRNEELGWYIGSNSRLVDNPRYPGQDFWLNSAQIYNFKTKEMIPYFFSWINSEDLVRDGYVIVGAYPNAAKFSDINVDSVIKYGVLLRDGGFLVEPQFDNLQQFTRTGNATTSRISGTQECSYYNEFNELIEDICLTYKYGLVNIEKGILIDTNYDAIESTTPNRMNWNTPNFDKNGHVKVVNYRSDNESEDIIRYVGLASIDGVLFEGAEYELAYYKNGYYYLKKFNENWFVIDGSNLNNKKEVITPNLEDGAEVSAIELVDDYIIVTQKIYDPVFQKSYEYYGVLNQDMTQFLDFDYSKIEFKDGKFYLEIYNTILGTTQQAVMDESKNYLVPFNNKYESISDYVDGYAIGQSGTKEVDPIGASLNLKLLNIIFLDVHAENDEFVLEVLDEDGSVVGDLSDEYESATLLGNVDGITKALVKKNGKFYIASLVEKPIERIALTGVQLNLQTISLKVGESYNLVGTTQPTNTNDSLKVEWISSDNSSVYVDANGKIEAIKEGTVTITYKVNDFSAVATIIVKPNTQSNSNDSNSSNEILNTILSNNSNLDEPTIVEVRDNVQTLIDVLNGNNSLDDIELLKVIREVYQFNSSFVSQLNDEEAKVFEENLNRIISGLFRINTINDSIQYQIEGLLLGLDLMPLLNGTPVAIEVKISEEITESDKTILSEYISRMMYDEELVYSIDIELYQFINSIRSKLNDLDRPVTFTFLLPDKFKNVGKLKIIHIHNGEVKELKVTLNPNYTYSFSTDQLSSFTLVKDEIRNIIVKEDTSSSNYSGNFNIIWFGVITLIGFIIGVVLIKRSKTRIEID